jgi:hypothetical protein
MRNSSADVHSISQHSQASILAQSPEEDFSTMDLEEKKIEMERDALEKRRKDLEERKSKARQVYMAREEIGRREKHLRRDISAIETLRSNIPNTDNLASDMLLASKIKEDKRNELDRHARELVASAQAFVEKKKNYVKLIAVISFFGLYCFTLVLQRNGTAMYEIESRFGSRLARPPFNFGASVCKTTDVFALRFPLQHYYK